MKSYKFRINGNEYNVDINSVEGNIADVTVNGASYQVEMENAMPAAAPVQAAPVAAPVATPADAALMMQLGAEGVFVGSGIFKSGNPEKRAAAIVQAVTNYNDAKKLAELSEDLGEAMVGINEHEIEVLMAERGK